MRKSALVLQAVLFGAALVGFIIATSHFVAPII